MVFTIEPMLNEGTRNIKFLADRWTVITKDKKLSAQFEHTVAVTETWGGWVLINMARQMGLSLLPDSFNFCDRIFAIAMCFLLDRLPESIIDSNCWKH